MWTARRCERQSFLDLRLHFIDLCGVVHVTTAPVVLNPTCNLGNVVWPFDDIDAVHDICRTGREIRRQRPGHRNRDSAISVPEHRLHSCTANGVDHSLHRYLIACARWAVRERRLFTSLHRLPPADSTFPRGADLRHEHLTGTRVVLVSCGADEKRRDPGASTRTESVVAGRRVRWGPARLDESGSSAPLQEHLRPRLPLGLPRRCLHRSGR